MSRVNNLDFSAKWKIRKPYHYEREHGFSAPLSAQGFADIIEKRSSMRLLEFLM